MENLATLIKLRGRVKGRLTAFSNFLEKARTIVEKRAEISARLEKLEDTWKDFIAVQDSIEELDATEPQLTERSQFEDTYFSSVTLAKALLPTAETTPPTQAAHLPMPSHLPVQSSLRLPSISLPRFSGNYEQWTSFKDLFTSLIHENLALTPVQKLHYLKSSLAGEAAQALNSLELTNDNYSVAWNLLDKRYENKRLIVQHHIQALLDLPAINKESYSALRQLVDDVTSRIQNLLKLGQPVDTWDTLLIHILLPKVDKGSRREWESQRATNTEFPTLKEFTNFLTQRSAFIEALTQTNNLHQSLSSTSVSVEYKNSRTNKHLSHAYVTSEDIKCPTCIGNHKIYECTIFHKMQPTDRYHEVKNKKLCILCLKSYHGRNCRAPQCKICHKYHHTLLHINCSSHDDPSDSNRNAKQNSNVKAVPPEPTNFEQLHHIDESTPTTSYSHCATGVPTQVLLSTAVVLIKDKRGKYHPCRALLDSGSQSNFITQDLSDKLQLNKRQVNTTILSINKVPLPTTHQVSATLKSRHNCYKCTRSFVVLEKITDRLPTTKLNKRIYKIPPDIKLADPNYHTPGNIDILLGASVFWELLCVGQIKTSKRQPIFQKTQFGWVISGSVQPEACSKANITSHCCFTSQLSIQRHLEQFRKVEKNQGPPREKHFKQIHRRDDDSRFIVTLPFNSTKELGESKANVGQNKFRRGLGKTLFNKNVA